MLAPRSGWRLFDLRELWRYRELLYFLVWRDLNVRYKQAVLGAAWAVLQPLATMIVFGVFLGRLAGGMPSNIPYPLYLLAGLLPWSFFANAVSSGGHSVIGSQNLVTKVYFPRLLIPLGAVGAGLVDFAISLGLLAVLMGYYGAAPGFGLVLMPVLTLALIATALGVGALLGALTVSYRDFRHIVPFLVQLWMFATPSVYLNPQRELSPALRSILPLNPLYGLVLNFRASVLGLPFDPYSLALSSLVGALLMVVGCLYFRRVECSFADII